MLRFFLHYGIHFLVPIAIGILFFPKEKRIWVIFVLLAGMVIDIDHLLAEPVFDPNRCSIDFHPLHSYWAISFYTLLFVFRKTRVYGLAFLIHILADITDCSLIFLQSK